MVELIRCDFLETRNLKADFIFLNPAWVPPRDTNERFSIFTHIQPDIRDTLKKSLQISKNISLLLPKFTELKEIATLFGELQKDPTYG